MNRLRTGLNAVDMDVAVITDHDSVYYFTGYYNYLHLDFRRPTILVVPREDKCLLITPTMEMDMAEVSAVVDRIRGWNNGMGKEWRESLPKALEGTHRIAVEPDKMPRWFVPS